MPSPLIIAIASTKGGVGKTTLSAFLGLAYQAGGRRVLSVDLDHNSNLSDFYLRGPLSEGIDAANVRHVLMGSRKAEDAIRQARLGPIIPATAALASVGKELALDSNPMATSAAVLRLRSGLRRLMADGLFDIVIIDTPPALSLELTAGIYASDAILVPESSMSWVVGGYKMIEGEAVRASEIIGKPPRLLAVPSMVSESEAEAMREAGIWTATRAYIPRMPAIRLAADAGRALKEGTIGERAFRELAEEVGA